MMQSVIITDYPISNTLVQIPVLQIEDLFFLNCHKCMTCFRTPGYCHYRDDMTKLIDAMQTDVVVFVAHVRYGCFDQLFLKMLERLMAWLSPYYQVDEHGHTCHPMLQERIKKLVIIGYGDMTTEEQDVFQRLVAGMPHFYQDLTLYFTSEDELPHTLKLFGGIHHG